MKTPNKLDAVIPAIASLPHSGVHRRGVAEPEREADMERASQSAGKFVRDLAELAARLAAKDIVVTRLHTDWSSFGCWELQAERATDAELFAEGLRGPNPLEAPGPEVVRVLWDGRDRFVTIQTSPTRFCSAPNEWTDEFARGFDEAGAELMDFVEDFLTKRFAS